MNNQQNSLLKPVLVIVAVLATIVVNILANALPINGLNTGEISDRFDILFVPAGYVFSIWGLIYLGLIAYAIYQVLPAQRDNPRLQAIAWPVIISSVANIIWIFLWHYQVFALTLVAMVALLLSLIIVYQRLGIGKVKVSRQEFWFVHVPFSIYLGWITVATIANATQLLDYVGWNGFGISDEIWFLIILGVAILIAAAMAFTRRDVAYLLVLAWAFYGINVQHTGSALVSGAALVATIIMLLLAAYSFWQRRKAASG